MSQPFYPEGNLYDNEDSEESSSDDDYASMIF